MSGVSFRQFAQTSKPAVETPAVQAREVVRALDLAADIQSLYENGIKPGLSTGWRSVDEFFKVRPGEFTVITGIPGHGKSSWLDNVMVNMAQLHGWKWCVFSAENYPVSRHIAGLAEIYTGKPFSKGPTPRINAAELRVSLEFINEHFGFIHPRDDGYSLDHIVKIAEYYGELNALVIDPWNELDNSRPRDQREDEFVSVGLSRLRWLARTFGIHVFVVAHPAKYLRRDGERKPVITLNEVKGASEWYAKADNGISVWRDESQQNSVTEIHIQKIRFRENGHLGRAELYYDRVTGRFIDPLSRDSEAERATRDEYWQD